MQRKPLTERFKPLFNPLIVALDVDSDTQALHLAEELQEFAGAFKIGPRLALRYGQSFCQKIAAYAPLFLDCKFFDIPSTMEAAVQASFYSGASLVTVHALSGAEALSRLAVLEKKLNEQRPFRILCVTILTSWDGKSFPVNFKIQSVAQHVQELASLVKSAGLTGLVCSAEELDLLSNQGLYLVTPGIRLDTDDKNEQKRTRSPYEALKAGASGLVVGRPIVLAKDPRAAAMEIALSMVAK